MMAWWAMIERRPGGVCTVLALAAAMLAGVATAVTATEMTAVVSQLVGLALVLHIGWLLVGARRMIAAASLPLFGAVLIESVVGDNPAWVRSIVIGCLWFVALELADEAIDRRGGAIYTAAATWLRVREVATIVAISLAVGLAGVVVAGLAPVRSIALQALLVFAVLLGTVVLARTVTAAGASAESRS